VPLLRLIVPPAVTEELVAGLRDLEECSSIVVSEGAAVHPPGDLVRCEVSRDAVDGIVEDAARLGVTVWLQESEALTVNREPRRRSDVVVWAQVADVLSRSGHLSVQFLLLITIAGGIATVGIIQNQFLLVVAAMALSPDYFPLITGCLGLVRGEPRAVLRSMGTLALGFGLAAVGGWAITSALRQVGAVGDIPAGQNSVSLFVARPTTLSVVVACLAGVAGALAVTASDNRTLVGVFVSITTIPAAAGVGVGLAVGNAGDVYGSAAQLAVNLACLYLVGAATLWVRRRIWQRQRRHLPHAPHPMDGPAMLNRQLEVP